MPQYEELLKRVAVQTTAKPTSFLGRIVWYTVAEAPVAFETLESLLTREDIHGDFWPNRTRPVDAFKCATRDAAEPGYVVAYGTKVEDGVEKRDPAVMLVAERTADADNRNLPVAIRVRYDAERESIAIEEPFAFTSNGSHEDVAGRIQRRFETYKRSYTDSDVRSMLSKGLKRTYAFPLKRHGGVYFVPEEHGSFTERVGRVVNELPGCEMVSIPVVDRAPERGTLIAKFERETLKRIEELMLMAKARMESSEPLTPSAYGRLYDEVQYLKEQKGKYEELLRTTMSTVDIEADALEAYLRKLSDKVTEGRG